MSPRKGIGLVSLLFGNVHSFSLIKLRFEGTSAPLFFAFCGFTVFPIFFCFTDFTARQIGHLYKSTFISSQSFFYSKCKGNTNNPISSQGAGFTHIGIIPQHNRLCILLSFRLVRLHTRAGMIPPFHQSSMTSEITLCYRQVRVREMAKQKLEK